MPPIRGSAINCGWQPSLVLRQLIEHNVIEFEKTQAQDGITKGCGPAAAVKDDTVRTFDHLRLQGRMRHKKFYDPPKVILPRAEFIEQLRRVFGIKR